MHTALARAREVQAQEEISTEIKSLGAAFAEMKSLMMTGLDGLNASVAALEAHYASLGPKLASKSAPLEEANLQPLRASLGLDDLAGDLGAKLEPVCGSLSTLVASQGAVEATVNNLVALLPEGLGDRLAALEAGLAKLGRPGEPIGPPAETKASDTKHSKGR